MTLCGSISYQSTGAQTSNTYIGKHAPDKLVAVVREQVEHLARALDVEEVAAALDEHEVEDDDGEGVGRGHAEDLGVEARVEAGVQRGEEDVSDEGHDGDVEVGRVDVVVRG